MRQRERKTPSILALKPAATRLLIRLTFTGGLAAVLYFTLFPFRFEQFDRIFQIPQYFAGLKFAGYTRCCTHLIFLEPLANVLLFVPVSLGLASLLKGRIKSWPKLFVLVLLFSFSLSLAIEILQVFQPWRSPSLSDILMNSVGGCIGAAAAKFITSRPV